MGARKGRWDENSDGSAELPGQCACGPRQRLKEVFRVLHLCALLHHTRRRSSQFSTTSAHTWRQWVPVPAHTHSHVHGYCWCAGLSISRTSGSRMTSDPGFHGDHTHISRYTVPVKVSQSDLWPVFSAPGAVGHLSFTEILDTSLKVSWRDPNEKNGVLTGELLTNRCSCGSVLEHCVSSAKGCGFNSQGTHILY